MTRSRASVLTLLAMVVLAFPAAAHALAPVGSGVVGLWRGEGDATDSLLAHDGTLLGGAGFAPASSGQAFSFTGAQQAVEIPDAPSLYPTESFTVAGWVRTSDSVDSQALMGHYECGLSCPSGQANSVFALYVEKGKALGFIRDTDAGGPMAESFGQELVGSDAIADGADHYLAFERDTAAGELRLYVDGALASSAALNAGATGPLENLDGEADAMYLGSLRRCGGGGECDGSLVSQLSGLLDDAIYWERAVSGAEIAAIHAAGPNSLTTDVTAPTSTASAPATASPGSIPVSFKASDTPGPAPDVHDPSGLAGVDLYVKGPGESSFAKVTSVPGSAEGKFTYAAGAVGTYAFATVATDVVGNVEPLPASPDATTVVSAAGKAPPPPVTNFVTAVFKPPFLYLRLKCPARFKPGCLGKAVAVTSKDHCTGNGRCTHGKPMSSQASANQPANRWKVTQFTIKPQYTDRITEMTKHPNKKLLNVRQSIHSKQFNHGRPESVFHIYKVHAAP